MRKTHNVIATYGSMKQRRTHDDTPLDTVADAVYRFVTKAVDWLCAAGIFVVAALAIALVSIASLCGVWIGSKDSED